MVFISSSNSIDFILTSKFKKVLVRILNLAEITKEGIIIPKDVINEKEKIDLRILSNMHQKTFSFEMILFTVLSNKKLSYIEDAILSALVLSRRTLEKIPSNSLIRIRYVIQNEEMYITNIDHETFKRNLLCKLSIEAITKKENKILFFFDDLSIELKSQKEEIFIINIEGYLKTNNTQDDLEVSYSNDNYQENPSLMIRTINLAYSIIYLYQDKGILLLNKNNWVLFLKREKRSIWARYDKNGEIMNFLRSENDDLNKKKYLFDHRLVLSDIYTTLFPYV